LRLRLDFDVLEMLPRGRPAFDDFKTFVADFGHLNELLVLVTAAPGHTVPAAQLQRFADAFGAALAEMDTVAHVQVRLDVARLQEGMFGRYLFNYLPATAYDALENQLTPQGIEAQVAANRAILSAPFDLSSAQAIREDPFGLRRFVGVALVESRGDMTPSLQGGYLMAPGGDALLMFVRPKASAFDTAFNVRLLQQVHEAEAHARQAVPIPDVRVESAGSYVYALEDADTLRWDVQRYTLLALTGVLAVFYLGYRNLRILPFVTYPLLVSTLVTFPLDLFVYGKLNAISTSFAAILYGLSIDTGIHFYNRLLEERRHLGLRAAVAATVRGLLRPTLAASATSAIVFVVIGFSTLEGVSQLGILTAFGVMLNPIELCLLYPALAFLLPASFEAPKLSVETPRLAALASTVIKHARLVTAAAMLAGVVVLSVAAQVGLDVRLMHLRPYESAAARVEDDIQRRFGKQGLNGAVLVRRPDLETALRDSEAVARQLNGYRDAGLIESVDSITALVPSEQTQRERLNRYNHLPRAAAMQIFRAALKAQGFATEPFADFISRFQTEQHEIVHVGDASLSPVSFLIERHIGGRPGAYTVATYVEPTGNESLDTIGARLRRHLPSTPVALAGRALLEGELHRVLRRELVLFLAFALCGNFVLLWATFGTARDALVILTPVVWAVAALLAGMWCVDLTLDPVNLIAPTLVLGLGVDYGAFVVAAARQQGDMAAAIRSTGRALVVTGLTTVVGFGFLSLSRYPALSGMGLLAAFGLLLSLIVSIVLLPALWTVIRSSARP